MTGSSKDTVRPWSLTEWNVVLIVTLLGFGSMMVALYDILVLDREYLASMGMAGMSLIELRVQYAMVIFGPSCALLFGVWMLIEQNLAAWRQRKGTRP